MLLQPRPACLARSHAALKFGGWNWRFDLQTGDLTASSTAGRVGYLQLVDISLIKLEQSQEDGAEGAVVNLLKVQTAAVEEEENRRIDQSRDQSAVCSAVGTDCGDIKAMTVSFTPAVPECWLAAATAWSCPSVTSGSKKHHAETGTRRAGGRRRQDCLNISPQSLRLQH